MKISALNLLLYPVRLAFVRQFTKGHLKGLTLPDELGFVSRERAASWARGIRRNFRRGLLNYRLVSIEVICAAA